MNLNWIELLGTGASVVVAVSLMMKNLKALRIINTVGALVFAVYGLLIGSWPVAGLNAFIILTNVFYLLRGAKVDEEFLLVRVPQVSDPHLGHFLNHFYEDIRRFNPGFSLDSLRDDDRVYFILRETLPIVLFVYRLTDDGNLEVVLDYAVPAYRDRKNGRFLYSQGWKQLDLQGRSRFVAKTVIPAQAKYYKAVGFVAAGTGVFRLELPGSKG